MGIASGDYDGDGDEDLFVTNLVAETHVLYRNDGLGLFEDARTQSGLGGPTAASTGFGTDWLDYDNDGWQDLFIANGGVSLVARQRGEPRPYRMRNQLFRNSGNGRFAETSAAGGTHFSELDISRGALVGDIDNDGDVDVLIMNMNEPPSLLRNDARGANNWIEIVLEGRTSNRSAIGATVIVRTGDVRQARALTSQASYYSHDALRLHFGLGSATKVDEIEVHWPSGRVQHERDLDVRRIVTLVER
jgi:hypothetical protein